ncbi:hypothetical protein [Aliiglaciecola sp. LCG003]|uniref:hypothetical protein n=1 Tax=Aliiglaciecola sp. LCG003 TaxID=3053655 RepID=UPI002573EF10|nr:hypothetical protein [Aliiglaciecola sp. LCG003]WJG09426.1 hypothetical protein QR722_19190 [Aliiglaciecola sp. LCG003]
MDPLVTIIWACVIVFILTAFLSLLHVSGIYQLPDPDHGKILFKALVVEVVVISVGAFGSYLGGFNQSDKLNSNNENVQSGLVWENKIEMVGGIERGCIYFENDSTSIFSNALPSVAKENIKLKLESMAFGKLLLTGYGDPGHSENYSATIGMSRARTVADYLINSGASAADITMMSSGEFKRSLYVHPFVCGVIVHRQES